MLGLRLALSVVIVAMVSIVLAIVAIVSRLFDRSGDFVLGVGRWWSTLICGLTGVRVAVESRTALDASRPCVYMANHLSTIDIWALFMVLPPFRFIAKKQLAAIPLFGWAMWAGRFIFIDRHNPAAARRSIEDARERIRGGCSVLLFPEGTRTRDGKLQAFKKGGFHLAMDAGVPIVPVAIRGTYELMPRKSLVVRPGRVRVIIGEPIPTVGVTDRAALVDQVRGAIERMLQ